MYSAYAYLLYRSSILLQFVSYVLRYRFRKKQRFICHLLFVTVNIEITFNSIIVEATETLLSYGILQDIALHVLQYRLFNDFITPSTIYNTASSVISPFESVPFI